MKNFLQSFSIVFSVFFLLSLTGCAILSQERETVYVRPSGDKHFNLNPVMLTRKKFLERVQNDWEYAVMSENAYHGSEIFPVGEGQKTRLARCTGLTDDQKMAILRREDPRIGLSQLEIKTGSMLLSEENWHEWKYMNDFMSDATWCQAVQEGVAFKVYERKKDGATQIAVSFRGTVFSYWANWKSNLRWFIQWPRDRQDGNLVVQHAIANELADALVKNYSEELRQKDTFKLSITGHSLGGAFAQQLSYAFPPVKYSIDQYPGLKVDKVVVFNPSPVNGWYWVGKEVRERNAGGLPISRIYQHGEILAYMRLGLSYVYPPSNGDCQNNICTSPLIEEVRYNALYRPESSADTIGHEKNVLRRPIGTHGMRDLAAGLADAAGYPPSNLP